MNLLIRTLAAVAACIVFATGAFGQSTVVPVDKEPPPKLTVEPPLAGPLAGGEGNVFTKQTATFHSPGKEVQP